MTGPPKRDSDEDILKYVALWDKPFVTASDIEKKLSVGKRQTANRLNQLVKSGHLNSHEVGGSAKVYWLTDVGRETVRREVFDG